MKLESKPDDLCGGCGHNRDAHIIRDSKCDFPPTDAGCDCPSFVPPIVARLVEALAAVAEHAGGITFVNRKDGESLTDEWQEVADVLVECGRLTKTEDGYRWSGPR